MAKRGKSKKKTDKDYYVSFVNAKGETMQIPAYFKLKDLRSLGVREIGISKPPGPKGSRWWLSVE